MRKTLMLLTLATGTALSTPALAQPVAHPLTADAEITTGAVTGSVVGLGIAEGWFGSSIFGYTTAGGAAAGAAIGGVAGIGAITFIHAAITPCDGFQVLLSGLVTSPEGCVDGRWVGHDPAPPERRRR